jgi:CRP-like cAMP-binding protein
MAERELGKAFSDGESIFREGDRAECLYIVLSGKVVLYREKDGGEAPLAERGKGETFGEMGVFLVPVRTENARAVGETRVITADYRFVLKKFREDPSFAFQLMETMANRDRVLAGKLEEALAKMLLLQEEQARKDRDLGRPEEPREESRDVGADDFDFAPVGAVDLDANGIILGINLKGSAILGTEREELAGLPFASFVSREWREACRAHLLECGRDTGGVTTEVVLTPRNGSPTRVRIFSYPKKDAGRVVYRTVMTEVDASPPGDGEPAGGADRHSSPGSTSP